MTANQRNQQLVRQMHDKKRFTDSRIGEAFLAVPRHYFLPDLSLELVYADRAIGTKHDEHGRVISSSSQPSMMAIMLEQLALEPGHNVLEIGAGTGYNAALMQKLVAPHGRVTTVDFDQDLVEQARENLRTAQIEHVTVVEGDGGLGYAPHAPYDRIILTVGAADIAPAWWDQLKVGGILLLPLAFNGPQKSIAFRKQNRYFESLSLRDCGFLRLRGEMAPLDEQTMPLPTTPSGVSLGLNANAPEPDTAALAHWLSQPGRTHTLDLTISRREIWTSLSFWLAVQDAGLCVVHSEGEWATERRLPMLFEHQQGEERSGYTYGLLAEEGRLGLAVLAPQPTLTPTEITGQWPLVIVAYGPAETAHQRLQALVAAWDEAGRPDTQAWQVRAYPQPRAGEEEEEVDTAVSSALPDQSNQATIWSHRAHFAYALTVQAQDDEIPPLR